MNKKESLELIKKNWEKWNGIIDTFLKSRASKLHEMYEDLGVERVVMAPASSYEFFHSAWPGGYIDHVLRVIQFSLHIHQTYEKLGLSIKGYTVEELVFAAMHHDFGKMGYPGEGNEHYIENTDEWWRTNRGKMYDVNENIANMSIPDRSIYLLQHYEIPISQNEFLAIRVHDGPYEEANKQYWVSFSTNSKFRNNLPYILHQADVMAYRYEFEQWAKESKKFRLDE